LDALIALVNQYFAIDLFLQDHWKSSFFLIWLVLNNYVLATWGDRTGWLRLVGAFLCAMAGGVGAGTVNLAHPSVFLWPACFVFIFMALAVTRGLLGRVLYLAIAGLTATTAWGLPSAVGLASGVTASIGLAAMLVVVVMAAIYFLVRGTAAQDGSGDDIWSNRGRQMGLYILGVVVSAGLIVKAQDWTGPLFGVSKPVRLASSEFTLMKDCEEAWCPELVRIPGGRFEMGATEAETAYATRLGAPAGVTRDEKPLRTVTVRSFWLAKTEVTRGQFRKFVEETGYKPGHFCWGYDRRGLVGFLARNDWRAPGFAQTSDDEPVVCITWHDAQAYVRWLSRETGHTYRLPSEAEWEYAARAGTGQATYWGDSTGEACTHANVFDKAAAERLGRDANDELRTFPCSDGYPFTAPVGRFKANAFGLHDMLGNVWEWTDDYYSGSYEGAPSDGSVWRAGDVDTRVIRGGGWSNNPWVVRSAIRSRYDAVNRYDLTGFRVSRTD
jgi:formylglycine-generating enzyme required for sulfatase activity